MVAGSSYNENPSCLLELREELSYEAFELGAAVAFSPNLLLKTLSCEDPKRKEEKILLLCFPCSVLQTHCESIQNYGVA